MKESIGQAFILNLILFFFGILVLLYFGSINYSKAYKAKNRILNIIEKHGKWDADTRDEVVLRLGESGYQTVYSTASDLKNDCAKKMGFDSEESFKSSGGEFEYPGEYPGATEDFHGSRGYEFCVVKRCSSIGSYYQVITFMRFEVPVIGGLLHPAIFGETKPLYNNVNDSCGATTPVTEETPAEGTEG